MASGITTIPSDAMYHDAYKFANKSGISELDFGVNPPMRDVFASNNNFSEIDGTISGENSNFPGTTIRSRSSTAMTSHGC